MIECETEHLIAKLGWKIKEVARLIALIHVLFSDTIFHAVESVADIDMVMLGFGDMMRTSDGRNV